MQYIAIFSGLLSIIVGYFSLYQFLHTQKSRGAILGVITVILILVTGVLASGGGSPNPTPSPTPTNSSSSPTAAPLTPTPTVTIITENRTIPCAVSSCTVMIVLDTVTIDKRERNMRWTFTLSSGRGCVANLFGMYIEDPNGTQYQAGGQAAEGFTIAAVFCKMNLCRMG